MRKAIFILISSLAGLMGTPAIAAPQASAPMAQEATTGDKLGPEKRQAHRDRRLQRALANGVITQDEADAMRQRWAAHEERRQRFISSLTPEQKQLWDEMQSERRAMHQDHARHWKKLTPEQRQKLKQRFNASPNGSK